jgi:antitoxin MazE
LAYLAGERGAQRLYSGALTCIFNVDTEIVMSAMQKVRKWGNSLAVRIPREAAERAGIHEGDSVAVTATNDGVTFARKRRQYRMEDFAKRMTPENQPELVDWGPPVGKEFW